jgi:hypothetical protein
MMLLVNARWCIEAKSCRGEAFGRLFMKPNRDITTRMLRPLPQISCIYSPPLRQGEAFGYEYFWWVAEFVAQMLRPYIMFDLVIPIFRFSSQISCIYSPPLRQGEAFGYEYFWWVAEFVAQMLRPYIILGQGSVKDLNTSIFNELEKL